MRYRFTCAPFVMALFLMAVISASPALQARKPEEDVLVTPGEIGQRGGALSSVAPLRPENAQSCYRRRRAFKRSDCTSLRRLDSHQSLYAAYRTRAGKVLERFSGRKALYAGAATGHLVFRWTAL